VIRDHQRYCGSSHDNGRCSVGIVGSLPIIPDTLTNEHLSVISFLMVAASDHPLASYKGKIPKEILGKHTQIVLTDRSELSTGREHGVMSPTTWRLADLFAKHHFLLNGLVGRHATSRRAARFREGPPGGLTHRGRTSPGVAPVDVGCVADEVAPWTRRQMVHRASEANPNSKRWPSEVACSVEEKTAPLTTTLSIKSRQVLSRKGSPNGGDCTT
jgi:hypothetical protein